MRRTDIGGEIGEFALNDRNDELFLEKSCVVIGVSIGDGCLVVVVIE